jgi:hypothetical protein
MTTTSDFNYAPLDQELDPDTLYQCGDGSLGCGRVNCIGMSAFYNRVCIDGNRLLVVDQVYVDDWNACFKADGVEPPPIECENCGRQVSL